MKTKKCPKCGQIKPTYEFGKDKYTKDNLLWCCKSCIKIKNEIYRKNNKEKIKDISKIYYQKNKEKIRTKSKKRYDINIENERKRAKTYRKNNVDECRKSVRNHYYNNKEYYLERNKKRKQRLKNIKFMNNPFPLNIKISWHHINDMIVIPIPKEIHKSTLGKLHREKMNKEIEKIYGLNIKKLGLYK